MNRKQYLNLAVGIIFLIIAVIGIARDIPGLYVVCLVLGFMFVFQGLAGVLRKK